MNQLNYLSMLIAFLSSVNSYSQNLNESTVTDIDGNVYNTVKIGTQVWMKENLKVTRYSNGDLIGTIKPDTIELSGMVEPKSQWAFEGKEGNVAIYGRLYTWYTVVDKRNICPTGWHVPSDLEFCELENLLEPGVDPDCNKREHRGKNIGNMLKEVGFGHWPEPGTGATNSSGFTGLPGGVRYFTGEFKFTGHYGYFWSSTEFDTEDAWPRRLYYDEPDVSRSHYFKRTSFSVRCLKD